MIEADLWLVIVGNIFLFCVIPIVLVTFAKCWWNMKHTSGCMIAEVWEPTGDTTREIAKLDPAGHTVTVDNLVYRLPREMSDKELRETKAKGIRIYPRKRWYFMPNRPLSPIPLRIESWERNNPEPIRPFYGRVDEKGMFIESQLTVTGNEWQAQKSVIQATGIAMSVQEREAREKEWARAMANLPNKMIMYLLLAVAAVCSALAVIIVYQLAGM